MGLLLFKKVFADAIRAGTKTTTLRRWSHARCRAGQRVFAPGIGYLAVTDVGRVRLKDLRLSDATADGFPSLRALKRTLRDLYPERPTGRKSLYRVRFEWTGEQGKPGLGPGR